MQETLTAPALAGLAGAAPVFRSARREPAGRGGAPGRLAGTVLAHLPLGVAVIDADARLLFWNEHAACLFGVPPMLAAEMPRLSEILAGVGNLTPHQRDAIVDFAATHIAAGDRTEPESCLRISLGRDSRIAIQIRGIGSDRWMLVIDDGKMAIAAGRYRPPSGSAVNATGVDTSAIACLDALTGLSNRRQFNQMLRALVENASPASRHALLMIDLDRFKPINETLGHPIGDALLCIVAQRLCREVRAEDLLARFGGDEFAILIASGERAEPLATRVVDILSRPFLVEGHKINLGASVGLARFPEHAASVDDLVRHAELALYEAKSAGRQTWRAFEPTMAAAAETRRNLEAALRRALAMGELSLAYQPRLDLQTQTLIGFDAVLCWTHPILGNIAPVLSLPVVDQIGCTVGLDEWRLRTACKEAARWPAAVSVAVGISPRQLDDGERLFKAIQAALKTSGLAAERLELKITENSLLSSAPNVVETLPRLRACGVRIAMDHSAIAQPWISQLKSLQLNNIKIDQDVIARLGLGDAAAAEIRTIVALATGPGIATVADGAETAGSGVLTGADGYGDIQGEPLGRPIQAAEVDAFLRRYFPAPERVSVTVKPVSAPA